MELPQQRAASPGDPKRRPSFSNGAPKKPRPSPPAPPSGVYRECMKNHAAAMGGHALDGCGEFMPSPADPLLCAACGCHRNFHRRVLTHAEPLLHHLPPPDDDGEAVDDDDDDEGLSTPPIPTPTPTLTPTTAPTTTTQQFYSAPHMLMALSAGVTNPRKRFRTKFSSEQKEKMQELSEKLGWRMQKRDDALVEQSCRDIGVSRGVFKVWMHNNKHNFVGGPSSRRPGGAAVVAGGSDVVNGGEARRSGSPRERVEERL